MLVWEQAHHVVQSTKNVKKSGPATIFYFVLSSIFSFTLPFPLPPPSPFPLSSLLSIPLSALSHPSLLSPNSPLPSPHINSVLPISAFLLPPLSPLPYHLFHPFPISSFTPPLSPLSPLPLSSFSSLPLSLLPAYFPSLLSFLFHIFSFSKCSLKDMLHI